MELDELKYQLKNKLSGAHDKSADDLVRMLRIKTTSLIDKLKRSLYIEVVCAIVFTLLFCRYCLVCILLEPSHLLRGVQRCVWCV